MKANVFLIDSITREIVDRVGSTRPYITAMDLAYQYCTDEDEIKHEEAPTEKYPNRCLITTDTDYFIHYLKNN